MMYGVANVLLEVVDSQSKKKKQSDCEYIFSKFLKVGH